MAKKKYDLRTEPRSEDDLRRLADKDGYVTVVVAVSLADAIDNDLEGWNDALAAAVGDDCMSDINYTVVGFGENNLLHVEVTGQLCPSVMGWC